MRDAKIELFFADGDHVFRLGYEQIIELQEKRDCGPLFLLNRIDAEQWMVEDFAEIIRIGLIGGGMKPLEAKSLVERYVIARPAMENRDLARAVLMAGLVGAPDETPGEPKAPVPQAP